MITLEEKEKRREHWEYAVASCELEGCNIPQEEHAIAERYINGEINLEEFGELVRTMATKG